MANSTPTWSFSTQSNNGGSSSNAPASSAPTAFGSTTTTSGSGTPSLFGTTSTSKPTGNLFGSGNATGGSSLFGGGNQTSFSGFSSAQTQQPASAVTSQAPSLFGASTPTSKPASAFSFTNASTTPAGPPPSNPLSFSLQSTTQQSSAPGSANLAAPSSTSSGSNLFGAKSNEGLFPSSQPADLKNPTSSAQPGTSIFSQPSGGSGSNIFGNTAAAQPSAGLFGNLGPKNDLKSPISSTPQAEAPKSIFSNMGPPPPSSASSAQTGTAPLFPNMSSTNKEEPKPSFNFPPIASKPSISSNPTTTASNPFSLGGQTTGSSSSAPAPMSAATSVPPMNTLFPGVNKPTENPIGGDKPASSGPSLTGQSASSLNPFSNPPTASTSTEKASTTKPADPASAAASKANLGTSTSGPAPAAQSRLKNKSMDEIITRWSSDLSKYQKEFQRQAETVAAWDRMLVENSNKIQKLYGSTLEAQRATSEVERQLTLVENEQADIERDLDAYERQVDEMIAAQQGLGESYQGPDGERQRMYDLADRVNGRLDEMGKDLSSMIEEINDASSGLNKNNKPDDPLSQVVRILNSHLTQLQQIDQGAAALQLKVAAAQKASLNMSSGNGYIGPASDAADGFYRSFMGRR